MEITINFIKKGPLEVASRSDRWDRSPEEMARRKGNGSDRAFRRARQPGKEKREKGRETRVEGERRRRSIGERVIACGRREKNREETMC